MNKIAFGCSHTEGVGVEPYEAWPALLGATNFGKASVSADYILRIAPEIINYHSPSVVYILWPDWTRFEYTDSSGAFKQSLVADRNRIQFMETATEEWLQNNFEQRVLRMKEICAENNIKLVDITLYDLIPYIDHADRWPLSKLGHHYSPVWHGWVANIFKKLEDEKT